MRESKNQINNRDQNMLIDENSIHKLKKIDQMDKESKDLISGKGSRGALSYKLL